MTRADVMRLEKELLVRAQRHRDSATDYDRRARWARQGKFKFRVKLKTLCPEEEIDTELTGKIDEPLKQVIRRAEAEFKSLNERSDVQAERYYYLKFPDDFLWPICTSQQKERSACSQNLRAIRANGSQSQSEQKGR